MTTIFVQEKTTHTAEINAAFYDDDNKRVFTMGWVRCSCQPAAKQMAVVLYDDGR